MERETKFREGPVKYAKRIPGEKWEQDREEISRTYVEMGAKNVKVLLAEKGINARLVRPLQSPFLANFHSNGQIYRQMKEWGVQKYKTSRDSSLSGPSALQLPSARTATYRPNDVRRYQIEEGLDANQECGHDQTSSGNHPTSISDGSQSTNARAVHPSKAEQPVSESDLSKAADYLFNIGFFDDAFPIWEHILQAVSKFPSTPIPHTVMAYLCAIGTANTEFGTQRQSILPGACDGCSHEKLAARYPVLSREIQRYRAAIQAFAYPMGEYKFLYSLRTLACGWRLPEAEMVKALEHLESVLAKPCCRQDHPAGIDGIRSCLKWCHHKLSIIGQNPADDANISGIHFNTNRIQAIWISSVDIYCLLWDQWQKDPTEHGWIIKHELMGLSAANLLRVLSSLIVDAIPPDVFISIQAEETSAGRHILIDAACERAQWLLNLAEDKLYDEFKRKVLCPGPFKCWSTRDEDIDKRRRLRRYVSDVLARHFPEVSTLKQEKSYSWECTCHISQPDVMDVDPTPSSRSAGQSTISMQNLCERIQSRTSSSFGCSTPRMDLDSQILEPWSPTSL